MRRFSPLLLSTVFALGAADVHAQLPRTFHASLEAVDAKLGTLTVRPASSEVGTKRLTLNLLRADLPVTDSRDRPMKLTDLRPRDRVLLTMAGDEDVGAIKQESDVFWGLVTRNDPATKELTCKYSLHERTVRLTPEVKLLVDGQPAGPEAFPPGRPVNLIFSRDHRTVVEVRAGKGITQYHPYGRLRYLPALLTETDHPDRKLKVVVTEERYHAREFEYDPWATLTLVHGDLRLGDAEMTELRPYCRMTLYVETDTQRVAHVRADLPTLHRRKVLTVDHAARKLTVSGEDESAELTLAADAVVRTTQGPTPWEQVRVGDLVNCSLGFEGHEVRFLLVLPR